MPTEFRATTLITNALPSGRPVTVHEVAVIGELGLNRVHDPATPLLLEYFTRYSVISELPVLPGAAHVTSSCVLRLMATTAVGLLGTADSIPIEFWETNAAMFELSLVELADEPLDA